MSGLHGLRSDVNYLNGEVVRNLNVCAQSPPADARNALALARSWPSPQVGSCLAYLLCVSCCRRGPSSCAHFWRARGAQPMRTSDGFGSKPVDLR
jgi:hypothetical protein